MTGTGWVPGVRGSPGSQLTSIRTFGPSTTSSATVWMAMPTPGPALGWALLATWCWWPWSAPTSCSGRRRSKKNTIQRFLWVNAKEYNCTTKRSLKHSQDYLLLWIWIHLVWKHALSEIITLWAASVKTGDTGACHRHQLEREKCEHSGWQHRGQKRGQGRVSKSCRNEKVIMFALLHSYYVS